MSGRLRALIHRPRRKMHLASLGAGETVWLTFCDLEVPVFGTAYEPRTSIAVEAASEHLEALCAHCFRIALAAAVATTEANTQLDARVKAEARELVRRRRLATDDGFGDVA